MLNERLDEECDLHVVYGVRVGAVLISSIGDATTGHSLDRSIDIIMCVLMFIIMCLHTLEAQLLSSVRFVYKNINAHWKPHCSPCEMTIVKNK